MDNEKEPEPDQYRQQKRKAYLMLPLWSAGNHTLILRFLAWIHPAGFVALRYSCPAFSPLAIPQFSRKYFTLLWSDLCQVFLREHPQKLDRSSNFNPDSTWKELWFNSLRHWPLCYSWVGYQQANGPPRALPSNSVDHGVPMPTYYLTCFYW